MLNSSAISAATSDSTETSGSAVTPKVTPAASPSPNMISSKTPSGPELDSALKARAAELAPFLGDSFCVLPSIEDRAFWNELSQKPQYRNLVSAVENEMKTPLEAVPEELYLQFSQTGNRTNYQNAYARRNSGLNRAVLAECFENQGRFIPRIEEHLKAYFGDRSWVLPAHDSRLNNFNGQFDIDLVSSDTAWKLATIGAILGDRLSADVRDELDRQLELRCFQPFRSHILTGKPGLWWVRGINNWNAVCLAGVGGAALTHIKSKEERAWFLAAFETFIQNSNIGYSDDGYCTEGVGYWCYGFGHHAQLSEVVRRATNDAIQILDQEKLRKVALYGFTIEILPGFSPSFADCGMKVIPERTLLAFLNRYYGFHLDNYDFTLPNLGQNLCALGVYGPQLPPRLTETSDGYAPIFGKSKIAKETGAEETGGADSDVSDSGAGNFITDRTWFPSAQILILRPTGWKSTLEKSGNQKEQAKAVAELPGFAVAIKGGHNAEQHNHNDVGTYVLLHRGTLPALDLGGEVYTRRTFSKDRYVSDILNSWGHNVPVVAGSLQKTGARYAASVLKTDFNEKEETLLLDFAAAYDVKSCRRLTREFVYSRVESKFSVEDQVEFESPQTFEVPMVTIQSWRRVENGVVFGEGKNAVRAEIRVVADGVDATDWTLEENRFEADFSARESARRLGIVLARPVKTASVRITYVPVEK